MTRNLVRFAASFGFCLSACTSSDKPNSSSLPGDASSCASGGCTSRSGTGGGTSAAGGGANGAGGSQAGAGGSVGTRPNLCPNGRGVTAPFPTGVTLAFDQTQPNHQILQLLVNDSALFFRDQSMIGKVTLSDGTATTVFEHATSGSDTSIGSFAMDDANLYFSDSGVRGRPLGLARVPLTGTGTPTTVVNNPNVGRIAVSDGYVYYEDEVTTGIYQSGIARVSTSGGAPTEILRGVLGGLHGLAVGGGYVYFLGTIGVGSYSNLYLARVPVTAQARALDAGPPPTDAGVAPVGSEVVATTGLQTSPPVTDATHVYWGDEDQLMTAPLSGGPGSVFAKADPIGGQLVMTAVIGGITPHGASVYWSSAGCQALRASPVAGGAASTVVPNVSASSIVANSTHLFFTPTFAQILSAPL